jgi:antitoxin PrlF
VRRACSGLVSGKDVPYLHLMIIGRITAKAQTTIPLAVRRALGLRPGDLISYEVKDGVAILRRAEPQAEDPFASFEEWSGDADQRAYAKL